MALIAFCWIEMCLPALAVGWFPPPHPRIQVRCVCTSDMIPVCLCSLLYSVGDIEMIRLISNVERQQQKNAPPITTPTSRPDSLRDIPLLKEIQGRIQNAYRIPTPTINVNVS